LGGKIGGTGVGRRIGDQRINRLARVRGEGGDVNQPRNVRIGPCFGDHDLAVGVPNRDYGAWMGMDYQLRCGHISHQRNGRILDDSDVEAVLLQNVIDTPPAGAVHEASVDKNDIVDLRHRLTYSLLALTLLAMRRPGIGCLRRDFGERHFAKGSFCSAHVANESLSHGFDVLDDDQRTLDILEKTIEFVRNHRD
jgi:hypothetical protein